MANRPKGYGFSREVADRMQSKYSEQDECEIVEWICDIAGVERPEIDQETGTYGRANFHNWLKNGQVLCQLMNTLNPRSCKPNPPNASKLAAMQKNKDMENIGMFLKAVQEYGVKPQDLFQTVDLYEGANLSQVQVTLFELGSAARRKGLSEDKCIGAKTADVNVRNHDEQTLREGRNVIGLQMGTNQVASQGGMTPYGLGRQLTPQTK